jgi:hypothetical protein
MRKEKKVQYATEKDIDLPQSQRRADVESEAQKLLAFEINANQQKLLVGRRH